MTKIKTTFYLILEPERRGIDGRVMGIDAVKLLKTKPRLGVRQVAILCHLEVDDRLFAIPEPEITISLDDQRSLVIPRIEIDRGPEPVPEDPHAADETGGDSPHPEPTGLAAVGAGRRK